MYLQPKHVVMVPPGMKPKSTVGAGKQKKKPEVVSYASRSLCYWCAAVTSVYLFSSWIFPYWLFISYFLVHCVHKQSAKCFLCYNFTSCSQISIKRGNSNSNSNNQISIAPYASYRGADSGLYCSYISECCTVCVKTTVLTSLQAGWLTTGRVAHYRPGGALRR